MGNETGLPTGTERQRWVRTRSRLDAPPDRVLRTYLARTAAPRIIVMHDRYDHVIPVGESRRLWAALADHRGARYTELGLRHLRMPTGTSPLRIVREVSRLYLAWYPLFRDTET